MTNQTPPSINQSDTPSQDNSQDPQPQRPQFVGPSWRFSIWYMLVAFMLLWLWQDYAHLVSVKTVPYSEFKTMVADGRVIECEVRDSEIVGRAHPADDNSTETVTTAVTETVDGNSTEPAETSRKTTVAQSLSLIHI